MAKKKGKGGKGKGKRRSNPKKGGHRRRRNPRVTFGQALGKVLGGAAVMLGTGVIVTVATAKIAPGNPLSMYGIPAVVAIGGAALIPKAPTVGIGMALGGVAPFVLPVGSRVLAAETKTTNGVRRMSSASSRRLAGHLMEAMGAVEMGAVEMGDFEDDDDNDAEYD